MDGDLAAQPVEQFLAEQAATAAWKIDRADRVETARLAAIMRTVPDELARHQREEAAALGRRLLGEDDKEAIPDFDHPLFDGPLRQLLLRHTPPPKVDPLDHPETIVRRLESTAAGCRWLLDRWAQLRAKFERDGDLFAGGLVQAIRLHGWRPLDMKSDQWEYTCDLVKAADEKIYAQHVRQLVRQLDPEISAKPAERRAGLVRVVERAVARLTALAVAHEERAAAEAREQADWLSFETSAEAERLRRYHFGCGRQLHRSLEALMKVRRHLGDQGPDPETPGTTDPGPAPLPPVDDPDDRPEETGGETPAARLHSHVEPEATADHPIRQGDRDRHDTPRNGQSDSDERLESESTERSQDRSRPAPEPTDRPAAVGAVRALGPGCDQATPFFLNQASMRFQPSSACSLR